MLDEQLRLALDRRRKAGILRDLKRYSITYDSKTEQDAGPSLIDFSSNDYMGLARCKKMKNKIIETLQDETGDSTIGSTGSRLLDGNSNTHEEIERRLARHFDAPSALLFNSGYDANTSIMSVLPQPEDFILYDELVHASTHDGMKISRTQSNRRLAFRHNDVEDLSRKIDEILFQNTNTNIFISVEAVYSMDGDVCPLREMCLAIETRIPREKRCFIVDEAHSVGLYGNNGSGLCNSLGISSFIDIRLATFGKAFGCSGAAVLCQPLVRSYLINYARPLIYSTAIPNTTLISINAALNLISTKDGNYRAEHVFNLTQIFLNGLNAILGGHNVSVKKRSLNLLSQRNSNTGSATILLSSSQPLLQPQPPIIPIITNQAREFSSFLINRGFLVRPIAYPTVPIGLERVRICLHSHNTIDQVENLLENIKNWLTTTENDHLSNIQIYEKSKL